MPSGKLLGSSALCQWAKGGLSSHIKSSLITSGSSEAMVPSSSQVKPPWIPWSQIQMSVPKGDVVPLASHRGHHECAKNPQREGRMSADRKRENEYTAEKKSRGTWRSGAGGFPEGTCDSGLEGQEGHCEVTSYDTALGLGTCLQGVPILTHLIFETTHDAGTAATPFYRGGRYSREGVK